MAYSFRVAGTAAAAAWTTGAGAGAVFGAAAGFAPSFGVGGAGRLPSR